MARVIRGVAALVGLVVGLVGVPVALVMLGGNPMPSSLRWTDLRRALFTPDDGTILLGLITIVGWLAWLIFAVSVVSEVVAVASGRRIHLRLPGLGAPQRLAAGLVVSVLALLSLSQLAEPPGPPPLIATTAPPIAPSAPPVSAPAAPMPPALAVPATSADGATVGADSASSLAGPSGVRPVTHEVKAGDDLWSLAERYYGEGRDWRKIAAANPDVLTGGPDRLRPGWRLTIPGVAAHEKQDDARSVVVRRGDTLSSLADRELGSASRWSEIYHLNRDRLDDPDELVVGMRLDLPASPSDAGRETTRGARARSSEVESRETQSRKTQSRETQSRETRETQTREAPTRESQSRESRSPKSDSQEAQSRPEAESAGQDRSARPAQAQPPVAPSTAPASPASTAPATVPTASAPATAARGPVATTSAPATSAPASTAAATSPGSIPAPAEPAGVPGLARFSPADWAVPLAGVGGLLAAGLIAGLALRRRVQLQQRPVGRRIAHPSAPAKAVEVALGARQRPLSLRTLDRATRAIAAHCRTTGGPLPPLLYALVGDHELELVFNRSQPNPPVGFTTRGRSWLLSRADAAYLGSVPGLSDSCRPWPALVTLGRDSEGRQVVADLEAMGLVQLRSDEPAEAEAVLAAMAVELSFSPWADEMMLTLVGSCEALPAALGKHNVTRTDDLDGLLERLTQRAAIQREHQPQAVLGEHRLDPDLADPWAPEIVLINATMSSAQQSKLAAVVEAKPRVTMAAVVTDASITARWSLQLPEAGKDPAGLLEPPQIRLTPQRLDPPTLGTVVDLVSATGSEVTTPAPWWTDAAVPPDPPPDNVTFLGRRGAGWGTAETAGQEAVVRSVVAHPEHPTLQLLGPIELLGAAGDPPPRAGKQCLEYCAWLLENPGTTAQAMASALVVAEGTRRSNMSRLRSWLGADSEGGAYLPDAYTGRILLHPAVSSDWQQLQILTGPGVNRATDGSLRAALGLVRGAPLADAAPGQWHWAEELRTDMISCLRDIGVELTARALQQGDVDGARWAAARALVAAPGDELLMAARIRTEHRAGNSAETERLTLQLAAQARSLGVELDPDTVILLQQVMEGRVRARMA